MTSKEALRNIAGHSMDFNEEIWIISKDLEVLEILKPYFEISSEGIISCHNLILIPTCESYKEQYEKVGEWLNEKNI